MHMIAYSDASNFVAASFIVNRKNSVHRPIWSEIEQIQSSTFRKIRAVHFRAESLCQIRFAIVRAYHTGWQ